jgi:hypothetical protein
MLNVNPSKEVCCRCCFHSLRVSHRWNGQTLPSFAQKVHSAFETCTKLLRYRNLSALELIMGLVTLSLEMLSLLKEVSKVLEVRSLRCSPVDKILVNLNAS